MPGFIIFYRGIRNGGGETLLLLIDNSNNKLLVDTGTDRLLWV